MKSVILITFIAITLADLNILPNQLRLKKQREDEKREKQLKIIEAEERQKKLIQSKEIIRNALKTLTPKERNSLKGLIGSNVDYMDFEHNKHLSHQNKLRIPCNSLEGSNNTYGFNSTQLTTSNTTQNMTNSTNATLPHIPQTNPDKELKQCKTPKQKKPHWNTCKFEHKKLKLPKKRQEVVSLINTDKKRIICPVKKQVKTCKPREIIIDVNDEKEKAARAIRLIKKADAMENDFF
ncbi:Uncharacterized protein QTN25_002938 [Entamoeba marina]